MIILDTNVLSALMRQTPDPSVVAWLDQQPQLSISTTSITVLEVRFGLQIMATGKRRSAVIQAFESVLDKIGQRVIPFDVAAAER
jgi:toxin FitB